VVEMRRRSGLSEPERAEHAQRVQALRSRNALLELLETTREQAHGYLLDATLPTGERIQLVGTGVRRPGIWAHHGVTFLSRGLGPKPDLRS
jgi:hypothetical protein